MHARTVISAKESILKASGKAKISIAKRLFQKAKGKLGERIEKFKKGMQAKKKAMEKRRKKAEAEFRECPENFRASDEYLHVYSTQVSEPYYLSPEEARETTDKWMIDFIAMKKKGMK